MSLTKRVWREVDGWWVLRACGHEARVRHVSGFTFHYALDGDRLEIYVGGRDALGRALKAVWCAVLQMTPRK